MRKMIKTSIVTVLFAGLAAGSALAVSVEKKVDLAEAPAAVWSKIGGWCALKAWHLAVKECSENMDGDVKRRVLTLPDGATITERLTATTGSSYSYVIEKGPLPVANYASTNSVVPKGEGSTVVWTSTFEAAGGKTDAEAAEAIGGVYDAGLNALKAK